MTFQELELSQSILDSLSQCGLVEPTPIQERVIPVLLSGKRDLMGLAQTGTGKTAAFGVPILELLDAQDKRTQSLVLCPTRELCLQITKAMLDYGSKMANLEVAAVHGGVPFGPQIRQLKAGVPVIIATPGRLRDLLEKGIADLSGLRRLVLDEADQMLDMGFKDELNAILSMMPDNRQTLLFSATMPPAVARLAKKYMRDPEEIVVGERNKGVETVKHGFYRIHASDKYATLRRLIDFRPNFYGIIFCRTREGVKDIALKLAKTGYSADGIHGELSQVQRDSVMQRFRHKSLRFLVATDVAARGLDVNDLTHVIHYDLPDDPEVYKHRSGRTGRAGRQGESLVLLHLREGFRLKRIERSLGLPIKAKKVPSGKELCQVRLQHLTDAIRSGKSLQESIPWEAIDAQFDGLDRQALIQHIVTVEVGDYFEKYQNAPDLNLSEQEKFEKKDSYSAGNGKGFIWLEVNVGRRDSLLPTDLIGLLSQAVRDRSVKIGRIDIAESKTDFQVENAWAMRVSKALDNFNYKGRSLRCGPGSPGRGPRPPSFRRGDRKEFQGGKRKSKASHVYRDSPFNATGRTYGKKKKQAKFVNS